MRERAPRMWHCGAHKGASPFLNRSAVGCCRTGVLFGSGRSLEMVRAEVPALSHAVPQDGNELNSMDNLKR
jgi:hypothetical protein